MTFKLLQALLLTASAGLVVGLLALYLICMVIVIVLENRQKQLLGGLPRGVRAAMLGPFPHVRRLATAASAAACIVSSVVSGLADGLGSILFVTLFASVAADALIGWHHRRRLYRRIRQADCRVCTFCMSPLSGLGDEGTCPECGQTFTAGSLRATWQQWLEPDMSVPPGIAELCRAWRLLRAPRNAAPME